MDTSHDSATCEHPDCAASHADVDPDSDHWTVLDPGYPDLIGHTVVYRDHCADLDCICHFRTTRATPAGSKFCPVCNASVQRQPK